MFHRNIFGATDVNGSSSEVIFELVPLNLFANGFQIYVNQKFGICCTFSDMIVTIICSTKLESCHVEYFSKSAFAFVRTLFCDDA